MKAFNVYAYAVLLPVALTGCGFLRPTQPPEALTCNISDYKVTDIYSDRQTYLKHKSTRSPEDNNQSFNVLSLSAGGEFGAYGAGLLYGWGKVGDSAKPSSRKDIQVVTGVSTGAILATHAFLGLDEEIEDMYRKTSDKNIYKRRRLLEYLWSNSLLNTEGKDQLIQDHLTSKTIDAVATQDGTGRFLYIGLVNLDSGKFYQVDMVKLAAHNPKETRDLCYRAVIGASSAIPIAFSPKFIDGNMWVDGGARSYLFFTQPPDETMDPKITRRLYSIIHGDLSAGAETVKNGVLQIAERTAALSMDQGMKDSIRLQEQSASACLDKKDSCEPAQHRFTTYYAAAAEAAKECKPQLNKCTSTDMFCKPFMKCLVEHGEEDGEAYANGKKWLSLDDLCLGLGPMPSNCQKEQTQNRHFFQ